jgi:hypothetical protein
MLPTKLQKLAAIQAVGRLLYRYSDFLFLIHDCKLFKYGLKLLLLVAEYLLHVLVIPKVLHLLLLFGVLVFELLPLLAIELVHFDLLQPFLLFLFGQRAFLCLFCQFSLFNLTFKLSFKFELLFLDELLGLY